MDYSKLSDNELIEEYRGNNEFAFNELLGRYRIYTKKVTNSYWNRPWVKYVGMDDILGMADLCLCSCVDRYDTTRGVKFSTFFYKCLIRKLRAIEAKAYSKKDKPMYEAILYGGGSFTHQSVHDIEELAVEHKYENLPQQYLMINEAYEVFETFIVKEASSFEKTIFKLTLEGYSVEEIAEKLDVDKKSVVNARYRMRNKMKKL